MGNSAISGGIYCISDIHMDHEENVKIIRRLDLVKEKYADATLILPGDISQELDIVKETLTYLKSIFKDVFFVTGNNELRLSHVDKINFKHSVEKFQYIIKMCEELGVHTKPAKVSGVWIVPLFAWYTPTFDPKWDGTFNYQRGWLDFRKCKWPDDLKSSPDDICNYFSSLNEDRINTTYDAPVITFSHFLPRKELIPKVSLLMRSDLSLVVGSDQLDKQIRKLNPFVHVCGHIHINFDKVISGQRYVQNALGHPEERNGLNLAKLVEKPKLIYFENYETSREEVSATS